MQGEVQRHHRTRALIAARELLTGLERNRRGIVLGRGQRPLGCTTIITTAIDAILARQHTVGSEGSGACNHEECQAAREHYASLNNNDFIPCTRAQAACQAFVARAAQWEQYMHNDHAGCWGAETCGDPWAFAYKQWVNSEGALYAGGPRAPSYPTNLDTAQYCNTP